MRVTLPSRSETNGAHRQAGIVHGRSAARFGTAPLSRRPAGGGAARGEHGRQAAHLRRRRAGVGKTYEMLQQAAAPSAAKASTSSSASSRPMAARRPKPCSKGCEIIPRKSVAYRGQTVDEMDLDAVIARHPGSVLVDELAHTNAPGSRHPKRYLDVEELLARGIDVYTTVNIQHIESLNDVIAQITGSPGARDRAGLGLRPCRCHRTRRYHARRSDPAPQAKARSMCRTRRSARSQHFFSPENLTALRELALRRTAERVDEQLLSADAGARNSRGHGRPASASSSASARTRARAGLVRYAKRLSDRLHAPFVALAVETPRTAQLSEEERDRIADTLRLAQALGGEAATIPGGDRRIADDVIGLCPGQQRHPDHPGEIDAFALVRDPSRLGGARSRPQRRQHQRPRHRRRTE